MDDQAVFGIDVVSDTICPWCFIGKRRLARALATRPDIPFEGRGRPERREPTRSPEGVDRKAYLAAKFGDGERLKAMSADALKRMPRPLLAEVLDTMDAERAAVLRRVRRAARTAGASQSGPPDGPGAADATEAAVSDEEAAA